MNELALAIKEFVTVFNDLVLLVAVLTGLIALLIFIIYKQIKG